LGYMIIVVLLFIMFYPALTGMTVKETYIDNVLRWFGSWDF
jgi:dolichyl-phosphate-mannose--protein O-mannosyl transferase